MTAKKTDRKRAQRKEKTKERRQRSARSGQLERAEFFFYEALWNEEQGNMGKALRLMEKAAGDNPRNPIYLNELGRLASASSRKDIELRALMRLYEIKALEAEGTLPLCSLLASSHRYAQALRIIEDTLRFLPLKRVKNRKALIRALEQRKLYCQAMLESQMRKSKPAEKAYEPGSMAESSESVPPPKPVGPSPAPEIRIQVDVDPSPLRQTLTEGRLFSQEEYELALQAYRIRFSEAFETLLCLGQLQDVRSFWYQEETVRKVMKTFRGRALLADEVGLGKTIEALMILKEYLLRGMVKSALILVPSPLVGQWNEELTAKFRLHFSSTEEGAFHSGDPAFWERPFVLASINVAKSARNFPLVAQRHWDLVIVDEAHHLKNRNTLNWKIVNALKKRFLLLLTATPVENNLIELHNLVTLLKPGQLKTAAEFKREFMNSADPTDPRNREALKVLLGEIMIRNTRAVAKIDIPPRFAQTVKVECTESEKSLYETITSLVRTIDREDGATRRLLLKSLLEEAGSSPRAVALSLSRLLEKGDGLSSHEKAIREAHKQCLSQEDHSKHRILLKLLSHSKDKIIVFVKYLGTLEQIAEFLGSRQIPYALFHGRMDSHEKEAQIKCFREEVNILVATEIGGEGRNLQFCNQMVNYDLPWNPMRIEQRIGRIHRIGQEREVMIYNFCAEGSIEEKILDILDRKINMFEMVIGEIDMVLGRIAGEQEFSDMIYDIWVNASSDEKVERGFSQLAAKLKRAKTGYESTKTLDEKLFGENYEL